MSPSSRSNAAKLSSVRNTFNQPVRRSRPSAPAVAIQRLCWCWDTTRRLLREWATASAWRVEVRARKAANRGSRLETNRQRSEEHTSELQSLMRISYAVFCLKKKKKQKPKNKTL